VTENLEKFCKILKLNRPQPHVDNQQPIPHPRSFLFSGHNISICCQPPPVSSCRLLTGPHARDRTAGLGVSVSGVIDRELCRLPCLLRQTGPSGGRRNVGRGRLAISVSSECMYIGRFYLGLCLLNLLSPTTKKNKVWTFCLVRHLFLVCLSANGCDPSSRRYSPPCVPAKRKDESNFLHMSSVR
jgi:hypothetical protein